jgi:translation initiation factor 3 subunit B
MENDIDVDDIDISDLVAEHEVQLESSFDSFVVIDGLPVVPEDRREKLLSFLTRKINGVKNVTKVKQHENNPFMPLMDSGETGG